VLGRKIRQLKTGGVQETEWIDGSLKLLAVVRRITAEYGSPWIDI
jgi:hypothetical protein